jgi:cytochrome c-type biogenesis protein CcmF
MLAIAAFAMSLLGTFGVRSGILVLLALPIGGALALFATRIGAVRAVNKVDPVSREGALVANNLLLSAILGIVLIGTFYPIVAAMMGTQMTAGPSFIEQAAGPVALLLVAIMAAGPLLRWRGDDMQAVLHRLTWPIAAAAFTAAGLFALAGPMSVLSLLGLALAAGLAVASVAPLFGRDMRRTPLFVYGMVVAHLGIAVSIAGMAASSAFTKERLVVAGIDEPAWIGPYRVELRGIRPVIGDNWTALEGRLEATRGDDPAVLLKPQSRFFSNPPATTSESAILTAFDGQLYAVLGQSDEHGRWQLRLWWKPWVTLIWLGGGLVALGGALSIAGHALRDRRQQQRAVEAAEAAAYREAWGA